MAMCVVVHAYLLTVELHDDRLSRQMVGDGVVASLDGYGGLLVDRALHHGLVLTDVTGDGLPVETCPAGDLPQT